MKPLIHGTKLSDTCKELILGNILFYIVGQIIILIFAKHKIYVSIGYFLGVAISVFMVINMSIALEGAMTLNERGAEKHVKKTTAIRLAVVLLAMLLIGFTDIGNILATLVGTMALKVSAYIQPLTHKVLARKSTGKGG